MGAQTGARTRRYTRTHPWFSFRADLKKVSYRFWMALGQACSKCEEIQVVPLWPSVAKDLHSLFLAKGIHATTAIEGNTLTEEQVQKRLAGKLELGPSREYLGQDVDNILAAIDRITEEMVNGGSDELSVERIRHYNGMVLHDLEVDEGVVPGEIRHDERGVGQYTGIPAEDCESLLDELCEWLNKSQFLYPNDSQIAAGIIKAILAHVYIVLIHPFGDGNGRTARLVEYQSLLASGVSAVSAGLLSDHYNHTRTHYYRQLDAIAASGGDVLPFLTYAVDGFVEGIEDQLGLIRAQQLVISWRDYVNWRFQQEGRKGRTQAGQRQRDLVIALSAKGDPVPRQDVRGLTPALAEAYAGKEDKTVSRDLNRLIEMGLLERTPHGYRAKEETMSVFLPLRNEGLAKITATGHDTE